jgi:hypothetical protein
MVIFFHLQGSSICDIGGEDEKILVIFDILKSFRLFGSSSESNDDITSGKKVDDELKLQVDGQMAATLTS